MENNRINEEDFGVIVTRNTISHLISYVPVVGDILTITTDSLQEREMNRLSDTLIKVQQELEGTQLEMHALHDHQQETVIRLYEQFAQQVRRELHQNKLEAHKNFLVSIIKGLEKKREILDEEVICLDILGRMSHVDLEVLSQIMNSPIINSQSIHIDGISPNIITGAVENLNSFGLVIYDRISLISARVSNYEVKLSSFGKQFVDYCLYN